MLKKECPPLLNIAEFTGQIDKVVREGAKRLGEAAQSLKNLESGMDTIKVPAVSFQTQTLDLEFGATVVKSVQLTECNLDLAPGAPGGEFTLYGPPITVTTTSVGLNLGQVKVVSSMKVTEAYPLQPIGDAFKFVGEKIEDAEEQITLAADRFYDVKTRTLEMKHNLEKSVDSLKEVVQKLTEVGAKLEQISGVKLFTLLPVLAAGFFIFIHLAFTLTGYALLAK